MCNWVRGAFGACYTSASRFRQLKLGLPYRGMNRKIILSSFSFAGVSDNRILICFFLSPFNWGDFHSFALENIPADRMKAKYVGPVRQFTFSSVQSPNRLFEFHGYLSLARWCHASALAKKLLLIGSNPLDITISAP